MDNGVEKSLSVGTAHQRGGLCRTCGDMLGEQGFLPTLDILDALQSGVHGSTIAKMIRDEKAARSKSKVGPRKRRRGRR